MAKKPIKTAGKSKSEATPILGVRVPTDLREFLTDIAKDEGRSLSNLVIHVLMRFAEQRGFQRKK